MSALTTISRVYENAKRIEFNDFSRIVLMSDCHRSDGSGADNFISNHNIVYAALEYYFDNHFTYIEIGDGDELWENKEFSVITAAQNRIFKILAKFYNSNRLHLIYGNHDMVKKDKNWVRDNMAGNYGYCGSKREPLFPGITVHEGIVLSHSMTKNKIFLLHGHQVDFLNNNLWKFSRFLVRYLWRGLELIGIKDPITPVNNCEKKGVVEETLSKWADKERKIIIAGHTHRPEFPEAGKSLYFNDGCCVNPYYITAIEIINGEISLVKWSVETRKNGCLCVEKNILMGPEIIKNYFDGTSR